MPRKGSSDPALEISFFTSGFYTYRSQLFAPFKALGVNVVTYRDPVLDGANMENTDLLQWTRRPGFAKFCPTQLAEDEIVNQFYSSRNFTGQVTAFFDSNTRVASFTSTGISTILNKTTAEQGYITTIGNMTYISDGASVDMQKWGSPNGSLAAPALSTWGLAAPTTTPSVTNLGCWLPQTTFSVYSTSPQTGQAILDPNGNIEMVTAVVTGTSGVTGSIQPLWPVNTNSTIQDGSVTWTNCGPLETWLPATNYPVIPTVILDTNGNLQIITLGNYNDIVLPWVSGQGYVAGDYVSYGGQYWTTVQTITNATPQSMIPPASGNTSASTTMGVTTVVPFWSLAQNPIITGLTQPVWNTVIGGTTTDGNYIWTNIGPGTLVETVGTSYVYGFRTIYGHLTTCSPVSLNTGSIFGPISAAITSFAISSNVITFQGTNNFIAGSTFTVTGLAVGTYLNEQTFVVLSSGLTTSAFTANFTHADVGSTSDSGSTQNLIATVSSNGTTSLLCNASVAITATEVSANIVTVTAINSFVPGLYVTFSGVTTATFLNGQQLQILNVDPVGQWFQVYFVTTNQAETPDTGAAVFNAVEIYRVSDGGGTYIFAGAVTNPGAGVWTYHDFTTDADLNVVQVAPQNNLNDPPPGAPGSSVATAGNFTTYWNGRIWMAVGNYVYFDAGPDCINGVPEEAWPPANRFQYVGPVIGLEPTPDGIGLLVYVADRINVILGGPETISFYSTDAFSNFGISNPNALFKDGSTLGQFTTQGQFFRLDGNGKSNDGIHIADYLAANFPPTTTYATLHRNGEDIGMFLSNGVDQVIRLGTNLVDSWSVPAFPIGGAGALRSIETSVGVYSLMLASPTGGGYLLARDLNVWQDNGQNYDDCFVTIGSITMSQPGAELFSLQHVVGYFDAAGTLGDGAPNSAGSPSYPNIQILPNEVSGTSGIGFIELPEVIQEPPIGQTSPSTTLLALRWPINMMNSSQASQFVHHLQVRIAFSPENAPNTIKALAFMENQAT